MDQLSHFLGNLPKPDWTWLVIILPFVLLPFIRRKRGPSLTALRAEVIAKIEKARGSRVIAIIHHRDRVYAKQRVPHTYIDMETAEEFLSALRSVRPEQPLDIVLHTPGGVLVAAQQIASALKAHKGKKTVFVPYHAFSAGTLIALGADQIVMGPQAVLGPIDPQIDGLPAVSLAHLLEKKSVDAIDDIFFILADDAKKALEETRRMACDLVNPAHTKDAACALTDGLASGARTHGDAITFEEAKAQGLNVAQGVPDAFFDLVDLYRDPMSEPAARHRGAP